jgi:dTMP kinase
MPVRPVEPLSEPSDRPARFVVFDGNEGCGKSTQAKLLQQHLQRRGIESILVRDPGTTRIGEMIRAILLNPDHVEMAMRCEMLLYMAARAQMMHEVIRPALEAGRWVISDRFVSSTLAYQLGGDGLTADDIRAVARVAISACWPAQTIVLDMPVQISMARVQAKFAHKTTTLFGVDQTQHVKDRIEARDLAYHEQVRANYLAQAHADPTRYHVLQGDRAPDAVHQDVRTLIGV